MRSSNITDPTPSSPSVFPVGSYVTALVNVTGSPVLGAFDIWLNYNLTVGPNPLQLLPGSAVIGGGLFDPSTIPSGCSISFLENDIDYPPGFIHIALTMVSSPVAPLSGCYTSSGNGILLTLTFQVVGTGAAAINIMQGNANGRTPTTLVGKSPLGGANVPFNAVNAYFRNKPGIPPVPSFTFAPGSPISGDNIAFDGSSSHDPSNLASPTQGMSPETIVYDSNHNNRYDTGETIILGTAPALGSTLSADGNVLFVDGNGNGFWDPGELVVYDNDQNSLFSVGDVPVTGLAPPLGTVLKGDAGLRFVDAHQNSIWDNGFVWEFGDGSPLQTGVSTSHVFTRPFQIPVAGLFPVKLVTWDLDGVPAEQILLVNVALGAPKLFSENWSGYAVDAAPGTVNDVKGSWIVPAIFGPCPSIDSHAAFWVGIDGLTSSTVEQIGTESACVNGTPQYFAWWEFFPKPSVKINQITVRPGDLIYAEVQFSKGKFNATIANLNTHQSFSKLMHVNGAQRSSVEWVAEAPSNRTSVLPLANFQVAQFGQDATGIVGTCVATIGTFTGAISAFRASVVEITMANRSLGIKALPSGLSPDGTSFIVSWKVPN